MNSLNAVIDKNINAAWLKFAVAALLSFMAMSIYMFMPNFVGFEMFMGPLVVGVSVILSVISLSKNPIFICNKNKKFKSNLHELNMGCLATAFGITLASISVFNSGAINVLFSLGMIVLFSIFGSQLFYFFKNKGDKDVAYFMITFAVVLLICLVCL